jgi:hypothetical protein
MQRGSILVLVLGIVLVMGALSVSFSYDVEDYIIHVNQINLYVDLRIENDSVLSIIIANLYLYLAEGRS